MSVPRFTTLQLILAATLAALLLGLFSAASRAGKVEWVERLCFSPSGKWLAAAYSSGVVKVWQMGTDKPRLAAQDFSPPRGVWQANYSLHFVDEGRLIKLEGSQRSPMAAITVREIDLATAKGTELQRLPNWQDPYFCIGGNQSKVFLADRPAGRGILSRDLYTHQSKLISTPALDTLRSIQVTANGNRIAARDVGGMLHVLDTATNQLVMQYWGESHEAFALSGDGSLVATIGLGPDETSTVVLLDADLGAACQYVPFSDAPHVHWMSFCRDGSVLAIAGLRYIDCYDTHSQTIVQRFPIPRLPHRLIPFRDTSNWPEPLALAPDGKMLVSSDGQAIFFWDVESGKRLHAIGGRSRTVAAALFVLGFAAWAAAWGIVRKRRRESLAVVTRPLSGNDFRERLPTPFIPPPLAMRLCWGLMIVGGLIALAIPIGMMFIAGPWLFPTLYFGLLVGIAAISHGAAGDSRRLQRTAVLQVANLIALDVVNVVFAAMEYALLRTGSAQDYLREQQPEMLSPRTATRAAVLSS